MVGRNAAPKSERDVGRATGAVKQNRLCVACASSLSTNRTSRPYQRPQSSSASRVTTAAGSGVWAYAPSRLGVTGCYGQNQNRAATAVNAITAPMNRNQASLDCSGGRRRTLRCPVVPKLRVNHHGSPNSSAARTSPLAGFTEWNC